MSTIGEVNEFPRKLDIEWKMKNFFSLSQDDEFFFSPSFCFDGETWCIQIYPNGDSDNKSVGYVDLFLFRHSDGPPVSPEFYFALKSVNGKKYKEILHSHVFTNEHYKAGLFKYISRSELSEKCSDLVPDGVITIVCTMTLIGDARNEKLSSDLKELMLSGSYSDATIKVKGEELRLHRNVLCARSAFFHSMFKSNMKEKFTGIVSIDDCEPDIFRSFIYFVYTGKVNKINAKNVCDLYRVSDKYQEDQLKDECLQFMMKNFCVDTFCDFAALGLKYDEKELSRRATEFFIEKVKEVIRCAEWQSFLREYPATANELYIKAIDYLVDG